MAYAKGRKYWKAMSETEHLAQTPNLPARLYTTKELCHILHISPQTLRKNYLKTKKLIPVKDAAGSYYFSVADIKRALDVKLPGICEDKKNEFLAGFARE